MRRTLFTLAAGVSAVLCVASAVVVVLRVRTRSDPAVHLSRLSAAATAAAERQAIDELWVEAREHQWALSLAAHDASGATLSMSDPGWTKNAVTVDVIVDGRKLTHRVVHADNLFLLMRE